MNLRRTLAISRRIANQFRRDERTLALMFVAPLVILGLLGWVIRDQGTPETRLAVVNEAGAPGERIAQAIEAALADEGIALDTSRGDESAARDALRNGELDVVIVLPEDLFANQAGPPALHVITPGINPADEAGISPGSRRHCCRRWPAARSRPSNPRRSTARRAATSSTRSLRRSSRSSRTSSCSS